MEQGLFSGETEEVAAPSRRPNDFYPTPHSIIQALVERWVPHARYTWEPCAGDGRFAAALEKAGHSVLTSDIRTGTDFFGVHGCHEVAVATNPPFKHIRRFIDHAFAIGVEEMALVCPERLWACAAGRAQFERHRPAIWANMDWREDYLDKGGSPDRALAVAIWDSPCAPRCDFQVWNRSTDQIDMFGEDARRMFAGM